MFKFPCLSYVPFNKMATVIYDCPWFLPYMILSIYQNNKQWRYLCSLGIFSLKSIPTVENVIRQDFLCRKPIVFWFVCSLKKKVLWLHWHQCCWQQRLCCLMEKKASVCSISNVIWLILLKHNAAVYHLEKKMQFLYGKNCWNFIRL